VGLRCAEVRAERQPLWRNVQALLWSLFWRPQGPDSFLPTTVVLTLGNLCPNLCPAYGALSALSRLPLGKFARKWHEREFFVHTFSVFTRVDPEASRFPLALLFSRRFRTQISHSQRRAQGSRARVNTLALSAPRAFLAQRAKWAGLVSKPWLSRPVHPQHAETTVALPRWIRRVPCKNRRAACAFEVCQPRATVPPNSPPPR
jgi:hypothetical protein